MMIIKEASNFNIAIDQSDFIESDYIKGITNRALAYIKAGFAVHLR
ncbi:hypothetical protein Ga0466249_005398, partial [Sporomusaceae bacterium BoRhaA]|nr:hypothetical protein [Pelorhabdus rhamnosifermentans]